MSRYIRVTLAVPVEQESPDEVAALDWTDIIAQPGTVVCEEAVRIPDGVTLTDHHGNNVLRTGEE